MLLAHSKLEADAVHRCTGELSRTSAPSEAAVNPADAVPDDGGAHWLAMAIISAAASSTGVAVKPDRRPLTLSTSQDLCRREQHNVHPDLRRWRCCSVDSPLSSPLWH
jgi:hypothetical protein